MGFKKDLEALHGANHKGVRRITLHWPGGSQDIPWSKHWRLMTHQVGSNWIGKAKHDPREHDSPTMPILELMFDTSERAALIANTLTSWADRGVALSQEGYCLLESNQALAKLVEDGSGKFTHVPFALMLWKNCDWAARWALAAPAVLADFGIEDEKGYSLNLGLSTATALLHKSALSPVVKARFASHKEGDEVVFGHTRQEAYGVQMQLVLMPQDDDMYRLVVIGL